MYCTALHVTSRSPTLRERATINIKDNVPGFQKITIGRFFRPFARGNSLSGTMRASRILCRNPSNFNESGFEIDCAGDLSLDLLSTIIDGGFVRIAVAAAGMCRVDGPFIFLSATHASNSCERVLKALLKSSEACTDQRAKRIRSNAAKDLAVTAVKILKTGRARCLPFLHLLHFITTLQAFSELQEELLRCEYVDVLSESALQDVVLSVMKIDGIAPQSQYICSHIRELMVVSRIPRSASWSAERSTHSSVQHSPVLTSELPCAKRLLSNPLDKLENKAMPPPRKVLRSARRSHEKVSKTLAVRCRKASQSPSAFRIFSEEVGETLFMSDLPNALAHGRRYRYFVNTAYGNLAEDCHVTEMALNRSTTATGHCPRSEHELSKFSRFMQTSLLARISKFAIHRRVVRETHFLEAAVLMPTSTSRAFSTVSAALCLERLPFMFRDHLQQFEELYAHIHLPNNIKVSKSYCPDPLLARLRGHSETLWMSCVFWGELSAWHRLTLEWLLVMLNSYLEISPGLHRRDTVIAIEILIHIRFLLAASISLALNTCNNSSRWGFVGLWMRAAHSLNNKIMHTCSSHLFARMMSKLYLGERGSILILQKYMDIAFAACDSQRQLLGAHYDLCTISNTYLNACTPCYLVKSFFTSIIQMHSVLHTNSTGNDGHMLQHSGQSLDLCAPMMMLSRMKCILEPRSGLATHKNIVTTEPCAGNSKSLCGVCQRGQMCINSTALAQAASLTSFFPPFQASESYSANFHVSSISFLRAYITSSTRFPLKPLDCDGRVAMHLRLLTTLTQNNESNLTGNFRKSSPGHLRSTNECGTSHDLRVCVCCTSAKKLSCHSTCSGNIIKQHLANFLILEIGLEHDIFIQQNLRGQRDKVDGCGVCTVINKVVHSKVTNPMDHFQTTSKYQQRSSAEVKNLKGIEPCNTLPSLSAHEVNEYHVHRKPRWLYDARKTHVHVLELVLAIFATDITRRKIVWNEVPARKCTALQLQDWTEASYRCLRYHLNFHANTSTRNMLLSRMHKFSPDELRLLRISCECLFEPAKYSPLRLIGRGSFANVYHSSLSLELKAHSRDDVAAKVFEQPQTVSIFSEIKLLEEMQKDALIVKLLDYGASANRAFIVMRQYPSSLKRWRGSQMYGVEAGNMRLPIQLHLNIFSRCVDAVCALSDFGVVHYDIKADNFLLEPEISCSVKEFWDPPQERWNEVPPFRVLISDFGESRVYAGFQSARTSHNHGTEYIKAPEMLKISKTSSLDGEELDRRAYAKCGCRVDAWALGCLLFEILANEYMYGIYLLIITITLLACTAYIITVLLLLSTTFCLFVHSYYLRAYNNARLNFELIIKYIYLTLPLGYVWNMYQIIISLLLLPSFVEKNIIPSILILLPSFVLFLRGIMI